MLVIIPTGSHSPGSSYREKRVEILLFGEGGSIPALTKQVYINHNSVD